MTILAASYRAHRTEAGCAILARLILRYADAGGGPMSNAELCHAHARVRITRARVAGTKVYDDREVRASTGD